MRAILIVAAVAAAVYCAIDWGRYNLQVELAFWRNMQRSAWTQDEAARAERYIQVIEERLRHED